MKVLLYHTDFGEVGACAFCGKDHREMSWVAWGLKMEGGIWGAFVCTACARGYFRLAGFSDHDVAVAVAELKPEDAGRVWIEAYDLVPRDAGAPSNLSDAWRSVASPVVLIRKREVS